MRKVWKSVLLTTVTSTLLATVATVLATAAPDGKTNGEYISNKVSVDGLEADTTYYYSYEKVNDNLFKFVV